MKSGRVILAIAGAALLGACSPTAELPATIEVTCSEAMPCAGELEVTEATFSDTCRYGDRLATGPGAFGAAGPGERYLEVEAHLSAHSTEHPDGVVLLDDVRYLDPDSGDSVVAPLALACAEADDGRVFWTKNVQPGMSANIFQPYVVPADISEIVVEGHRIRL